jgi:hypothetical protein
MVLDCASELIGACSPIGRRAVVVVYKPFAVDNVNKKRETRAVSTNKCVLLARHSMRRYCILYDRTASSHDISFSFGCFLVFCEGKKVVFL